MPLTENLPEGYRTVGNSGLVVSELGVGASTFGRSGMRAKEFQQVQAIVDAAIDVGVTYFDIAEGYGDSPGESESLLGRALNGRREQVIIGTKFGNALQLKNGPNYWLTGARKYILAAVDDSLRRLKTDYVDLYQIHFPDNYTPIEETLQALDHLVQVGKVRYVGASNFPAWQIADAHHIAQQRHLNHFISTTDEYNLLWRKPEAELIPALKQFGLGFIPYFPLQNGLLTGKYRSDYAPEGAKVTNLKRNLLREAPWQALSAFEEFAKDRDITPVQVAIGWLLAQPTVCSVIAGVTTPEQLRENFAATKWQPTAEEDQRLREILPGTLSGGPGKVVTE